MLRWSVVNRAFQSPGIGESSGSEYGHQSAIGRLALGGERNCVKTEVELRALLS
jgi:hypothetical protein